MQVSSAPGAQAADMARQLRERNFSRADRDGNGGLSLAEFAAIGPAKPGNPVADSSQVKAAASLSAAVFARVDANGDGLVTQAEMESLQPGGPAPAISISSATMSALLSGQELSGGPDGAAASRQGGIGPGPADAAARLTGPREGYLRFAEPEPSAANPAGG